MVEDFCKRLSEKLREKNISQSSFADMVGTSNMSVHRWLTGDYYASYGSLNKIAKVLDTPLYYFFMSDEEVKKYNTYTIEDALVEAGKKKNEEQNIDLTSILSGNSFNVTYLIGLIAFAKAFGKLSEKDCEQLKEILDRR